MIGLSVSLCIAKMVKGDVDPASVEKIIAGTRAATPADWEQVIAENKASIWGRFPNEAEALFRQFLAEGKIEQPRLSDKSRYPRHYGKKILVESEDEIVFVDDL